ncbi:MAG TPA: hypothetical protein VGF71_00615 [Caulobacteraceae bacterium]|jgi:hypothetical protein
MREKHLPINENLPAAEAEKRFKRTIGNLMNTSHKPHKHPNPNEKTRGARVESER